MVLLLGALGCSPGNRDDADEAEQVPIGPGSDSTALLPPDTPVSRREPLRPGTPPRDTTP
jgi:hypothetical protein